MNSNKLIDFVTKRRKELNLSQGDIAVYLGYSNQLIYNWEKNKSLPDLYVLGPLCNILKLTFNELFSCKSHDSFKVEYRPFDNYKFGENLKNLRVFSSLTQKDLAERVDVSYATIIAWEKGTSVPNIAQFDAIKNIFKISYQDLYYGNFVSPVARDKARKRAIVASSICLGFCLGCLGGYFLFKTISEKYPENPLSNPEFVNNYVCARFYDDDYETLLWSKMFKLDEDIIFTGAMPTKPSDETNKYEFASFIEVDSSQILEDYFEVCTTRYFVATYNATKL